MTRVPTTATYHLYMSQMTKQKAAMTDVSYQATSGNKYASYDKYGLSTYRLLSLQNEQAVTTKYLETNSVTQIKLETQQNAIDGIRSALIDIRSKVRDFYSADLTAMSKDPSEEEMLSLRNVQEAAFEAMSLMAYYLNTEIDGNYVFGGGQPNVAPVDFPFTTLDEFQEVYDGDIMTYSTSYSASLSEMSSSADVLGGVTIEQEFQTVEPKTTVYGGSASNAMTFDSATNTLTADAGTFKGISAGSQIVVAGTANNNGILTVQSVSEDGSAITFNETPADETLTDSSTVSLTTESWRFSSEYDAAQGITINSLHGRAGSFSGLKEGQQILLDTNGISANDGYLTIQSISPDGSTIVFEETVSPETLQTSDLTGGDVKIRQSTQTGKITAGSNIGEVIEELSVNRNLIVDTANNTLTGISGTFTGLSGGQTVTITDASDQEYTLYVKSVSEDGSTLSISSSTPLPQTGIISSKTIKTHTDIGGFITSSLKGSALQTGNVSFNLNQNSMTATVKGAFSQYSAGDSLIIKGADSNDKMYIVDSVSDDGRTVKFSQETRIVTEMNDHSGNPVINGDGLTICKTYSVGATVEMAGADKARNGLYTVLGVSDDGKELTVRTESFPEYGAAETFSDAAFETLSYYKGGHLSSGYRISETANIADNINAAAPAFEKIFRALGNIAQGNLLNADYPENAEKRVSEALDLIDGALTVDPNGKNNDITSIQYSVISRMDQIKITIENQTELKNTLESYIASLTQVDKTEAVTMLLQASENLKTSYSILSTMNSLSLLNYL